MEEISIRITKARDINNYIKIFWDEVAGSFKDTSEGKKKSSPFLSPGIFPEKVVPKDCKLLVIGVNPSFSDKKNGLKGILLKANIKRKEYVKNGSGINFSSELKNLIEAAKKNKGIKRQLDTFFNYKKFDQRRKNEIEFLEWISFETHEYFKKMRQLAKHIFKTDQPPWVHIDFYYYRKTNQNHLKKLIKSYPDFFNKQKELTKKIVEWLKPDIILIANAYAGELFREMFYPGVIDFADEIKINASTGTYDLKLKSGKVAHIFFSGMLSGQRALDLGSYGRIKWHMKALRDKKRMIKI